LHPLEVKLSFALRREKRRCGRRKHAGSGGVADVGATQEADVNRRGDAWVAALLKY